MNMITKKGSVVWIYTAAGIDVVRSVDVPKRSSPTFSLDKLLTEYSLASWVIAERCRMENLAIAGS
ncbi:hypothetical protein HX899_24025 [Rhizobium sp. WYCCWR 11146]|nr:hypothetical protein [Rhizobium sp. WYCCWR 11146]